MKVVFVNTLFHPVVIGGAEKSLKNLILSLVKHHSIDPVVITINPENKDVIEYVEGIKVYRLAYRNNRFIFGDKGNAIQKALWHMKDKNNENFIPVVHKILSDEAPDLLHTNNLLGFSAVPISVANSMNIPIVHTIRDYYFQCWRSSRYGKNGDCGNICSSCRWLSKDRRALSNSVGAVVGNSQFILNDHVIDGVFSEVKIQKSIYNIFEADSEIRAKGSVPEGKVRLGFLGRLHHTKGIRELLELVLNSEGVELFIAGDGEESEAVLRACEVTNRIHYLGYVAPAELFSQIDILVIPSLWREPLPRTAYEAYSYGIPVIGSNAGGTSEVIMKGKTGFVFPCDDFGAILSYIDTIISTKGLYQEMSENCIEYSQQFSPLIISSKYHETYLQVLEDE